jgi:hypothetical protein
MWHGMLPHHQLENWSVMLSLISIPQVGRHLGLSEWSPSAIPVAAGKAQTSCKSAPVNPIVNGA